jgi:hypothetical protein
MLKWILPLLIGMVDAVLLTRGKAEGQAIAGAGGTFDLGNPLTAGGAPVVPCSGDSTLVVEVDMTGGAVGDLTVAVNPYEADDATVMPIAVPQVQGVGPTLVGGHVYQYAQFDVTGIEYVRVRITNNNAGGQTITRASWRLA